MLKVLISKEIRDLIGSAKFTITFGACAFLIIMAFYVGSVRHNLNLSQYNASQSENMRAMEGLTDWIDLDGNRILLPPQPLAALVSGVSNDIGRTAHVYGRGDIPIEDSRYNEDPIFAIFRFIDLEFVFAVILSLFAILLGYDAISGEKERGTLKLSFANSIPRTTYLLGKLIGFFATLTVSILIAIAIGVLILFLQKISLSGEEWLRFILIIGSGILYFGVFLSLSMLVSAITHRSANSFLILLVIWVMFVHIIPRASVLLAARSVDVPTVDEIAYQKSSLSSQLREEFFEGMQSFEVPASPDPESDPLQGFNEHIDSLSQIRDSKLQALSSRLNEERHNLQKVQEKLSFSLAKISPLSSFSLAATSLAGTSIQLKNQFYDEAMNYQQSFGNFIKEKTGMNTGGMIKIRAEANWSENGEQKDEKPEQIDTRELPAFNFDNRDLSGSVSASIVDIGILVIFNLIFFAGAFVAFIRYDVR